MKLSRLAFSLLLEYKEWQDSQREKLGDQWKETDGRIFTGDDGGKIHPDSLTRWFKTFIKKHGFSDDIHFHSLRHPYVKPTLKLFFKEFFSMGLNSFQPIQSGAL